MVRFLAVSLGTVEAGLGKIRRNMDDAARSLGLNEIASLRRIHWLFLPKSCIQVEKLRILD
jgi:iron(III) transport system permease protein